MARVTSVFWRAVTDADFFNIERSRQAAPSGGGGQSYISISFRGLTHEDLGRFLEVDPPSLIGSQRPTVTLEDVGVVGEPQAQAPLEFAPRYQPPQADDRYRISRQNRQYQQRHPGWTADRGFPLAPDDVARRDLRMPDLSRLKVYIVRLDSGAYLAGFVNSDVRPPELPATPEVDRLFAENDPSHSAGVIEFDSQGVDLDAWAEAAQRARGLPGEGG